jgi:cytidylate kinase
MNNQPKRQITISGKNGAGKSTVNKLLLEVLPGYETYSAGDFMREIAVRRGVSLEELTDIAGEDPQIDKDIDNKTQALQYKEKFILDSRIGFHFLPGAFAVFLDCPEEVAAKRIIQNAHKETHRTGQTVETFEEEVKKLKKRQEDNFERYQRYYQIENYLDSENFDLVIDTSQYTPEEVRDQILEGYKEHLTA